MPRKVQYFATLSFIVHVTDLSYAKYAQSAARSAPILGSQSFEADVITSSSEVFQKQ
jgi:hypothetical protein